MARMVGKYFSLEEAQRKSNRDLTAAEEARYRELVRRVLDPTREAIGQPLIVTSFVRSSGSHAGGYAIDVQPRYGGEDVILSVADLIAGFTQPGEDRYVKQVLYEAPEPHQWRGHVHIATRLVDGATPGYITDMKGDQKYATRTAADVVLPALALILVGAAALALM